MSGRYLEFPDRAAFDTWHGAIMATEGIPMDGKRPDGRDAPAGKTTAYAVPHARTVDGKLLAWASDEHAPGARPEKDRAAAIRDGYLNDNTRDSPP